MNKNYFLRLTTTLALMLVLCLPSFINAQTPISLLNTEVQRSTENGMLFLQKDFTAYIQGVSNNVDRSKEEDVAQWLIYLNRKHPAIATIDAYLQEAADKYEVPLDLLKAIAYVESNFTQMGPSMDQRWGIMRLAHNNYCQSLDEAAKLVGTSTEDLKDNARLNILGAAALMSKIALEKGIKSNDLRDWFEVAKTYSGHIDELCREMAAESYYKVLHDGIHSFTLWGEEYSIDAQKVEYKDLCTLIHQNEMKTMKMIEKQEKAEYHNWHPGANQIITTNNYSSRQETDIDVWVNHWFGVGTWAGAISWFQDPSSQCSAHFLVRNDGYIVQMVGVDDKAWHATIFNRRSIGIEHHATVDHPEFWQSKPMLQMSAMLAISYCEDCSIPKERKFEVYEPGIYGHTDIPTVDKDCPGPMPWDDWMELVGYENPNPGVKILDDFEVNTGHFNAPLDYSGSCTGFDTESSTKYRSTLSPHQGISSLKINLKDDTKSEEDWLVRVLSGYGSPQNNISFGKNDSIRCYIKASGNSNTSVCLWIDDTDGVEATKTIPLIADDEYHKYAWDLKDAYDAITGNGAINSSVLTLDAIVLSTPNQSADISIYIDDLEVMVQDAVSIMPVNAVQKGQLKLYPNPSISNPKLSFATTSPSDLYISAYDLMGRRRFYQEVKNYSGETIELQTKNTPTGTYFIRVQSNNTSETIKWIKED